MNDALHEDPGRVNVVGIDLAGRQQMFNFGHRHLGRSGHHRIEVPRGLPIDEIAGGIALPRMHDREIGKQAALHQIFLAVEFAHLLALGHERADACLGEEGRDSGTAGADALGQSALRAELELQLARQILLCEQLILADIGRDHLPDLPRLQQSAEADTVDAGIVGDDGEILHPGIADGIGQGFGDATEAKPAGHDRHTVLQEARKGGFGVRIDLVHTRIT